MIPRAGSSIQRDVKKLKRCGQDLIAGSLVFPGRRREYRVVRKPCATAYSSPIQKAIYRVFARLPCKCSTKAGKVSSFPQRRSSMDTESPWSLEVI